MEHISMKIEMKEKRDLLVIKFDENCVFIIVVHIQM